MIYSKKKLKISIIEYDPSINDFRIESLHYFEDEKLKVIFFKKFASIKKI